MQFITKHILLGFCGGCSYKLTMNNEAAGSAVPSPLVESRDSSKL